MDDTVLPAQNRRLATGVLAFCAVGAAVLTVADYLEGGFWCGLLQHGFVAATIGGLADWYAVCAIFHKPLGIRWRTDVLRRNRPRIMGALLDFVTGDLLSPDNILREMRGLDFAKMLQRYLLDRGGQERILGLLDTLTVQALRGFDREEAARRLAESGREALESVNMEELLRRGAAALDAPECREQGLKALAPILRPVLMGDEVQDLLQGHIRAMREAYEENSTERAMVFSTLNLSDKRLLGMLDRQLAAWLDELEQGQGLAWDGINRWLSEKLAEAAESPKTRFLLEDLRTRLLQSFDMTGQGREALDGTIRRNAPEWREKVRAMVEAMIREFPTRPDWQREVNEWIQVFLAGMVREHYHVIPDMAASYLSHLSDDDMITLAESRVADDLQMIRINGSAVGALVGMGLYLLMYALEGVWG